VSIDYRGMLFRKIKVFFDAEQLRLMLVHNYLVKCPVLLVSKLISIHVLIMMGGQMVKLRVLESVVAVYVEI